jgi:Lsr2
MAQKTVVTVVCDLPHDGEIKGTESVSFGFDGNAYEIDLCEAHSSELRRKVDAFADHVRRVTGASRRRDAHCPSTPQLDERQRSRHNRDGAATSDPPWLHSVRLALVV